MRQYKLCIQIIIIIIIIRKKDKKSKGMRQTDGQNARRESDDIFYFIFLLFISFLDLWKSDRRFSSKQKAKLDYT